MVWMYRLEALQGCVLGLRAGSANEPILEMIPWPLEPLSEQVF